MRFIIHTKTGSHVIPWLKLFIICFLLFASYGARSQRPKIDWQAFLEEVRDSADDEHYVYLYYTRGGELKKQFYCYRSNNQQLMAINSGDTLVKEILIAKPDFFKLVVDNLEYLQAVREKFNTDQRRISDFQKDFRDSSKSFMQLGIRVNGLFYNHFQRISQELIENTKRKKLKEGYKIVNKLIDLLELSAEKGLADKK